MDIQEIQTAFDALPDWEKEIFLKNNAEMILGDITVTSERPNLGDIETKDIAAWMVENDVVTCDELLNAVVDDVEELREIMYDSAVVDYEGQGDILDEEEYYGTAEPSHDFESEEDFPY